MKIKKEYVILIVIVLGLSFYLILRNQDKNNYKLPKISPCETKDITKIEISKSGAVISLNKKDNKWYIAPKEYLADSSKIESMLTIIGEFNLTTLVSESKSYNRYDLDNSKKIIVKALAQDIIKRNFEIGKTAPSYRHTFVKLPDDDKVYLAGESFRDRFEQNIDSLRDKVVLSFKQDEISEISLTKEKEEQLFFIKKLQTKKDMHWETKDGKKADEPKISTLLTSLSNLQCEKFLDDKKKEDLKSPFFSIVLKGSREYTLFIYSKLEKDAKGYSGISSESKYVFFLPDMKVDDIMSLYSNKTTK